MLVTKPYGRVFAILKSDEHVKNLDKLFNAEYFRFNQHGANIRLSELGSGYVKKSIKIKNSDSIKEVIAVLPSDDIDIFKGIPFFENKGDAKLELIRTVPKFDGAKLVFIDVVTNMTKAEQK